MKRILSVVILMSIVSLPTLAGEIPRSGNTITGEIPTGGITGDVPTVGITGDVPSVGVTTNAPSGNFAYQVTRTGLTLIQMLLGTGI